MCSDLHAGYFLTGFSKNLERIEWYEHYGKSIFFLSERKPSFCLSFVCEGVPIYWLD